MPAPHTERHAPLLTPKTKERDTNSSSDTKHVLFPLSGSARGVLGKLSEMPRFLVTTRLQNLCREPHQLAEVLRRREANEAQIPVTKNAR